MLAWRASISCRDATDWDESYKTCGSDTISSVGGRVGAGGWASTVHCGTTGQEDYAERTNWVLLVVVRPHRCCRISSRVMSARRACKWGKLCTHFPPKLTWLVGLGTYKWMDTDHVLLSDEVVCVAVWWVLLNDGRSCRNDWMDVNYKIDWNCFFNVVTVIRFCIISVILPFAASV